MFKKKLLLNCIIGLVFSYVVKTLGTWVLNAVDNYPKEVSDYGRHFSQWRKCTEDDGMEAFTSECERAYSAIMFWPILNTFLHTRVDLLNGYDLNVLFMKVFNSWPVTVAIMCIFVIIAWRISGLITYKNIPKIFGKDKRKSQKPVSGDQVLYIPKLEYPIRDKNI